MRLVTLLLVSAATWSCASEHPVRVQFEQSLRDQATRVGVYLVQNCPQGTLEGDLQGVIAEVEFGVDETAPSIGEVEPGEYGLLARAWNDDCELVAAACRSVRVEAGGSTPLSVLLIEATGRRCAPAESCTAGECIAGDVVSFDGGGDAPSDATLDTSVDADVLRDASSDVLDANTPDVGEDGGVDAGMEGTFCSRHGDGAYACLDFESPLESGGWLVEDPPTGSGGLQPGAGVTGAAARVGGDDGESFALIRRDLGPHTGGVMWARMKVRVDSGDAARIFYMNLFALNDSSPPNAYMTANLLSGRTIQGAIAADGPPEEEDSAERYPTDEWFCLELEFAEQEGQQVMRVYVNEVDFLAQEVPERAQWDTVFFGPRSIASDGRVSILVDDFLWAPERLPCSAE
ncbi:MAG: hypothetical protein AB8H86_13495 [Polyangiales bacterium]